MKHLGGISEIIFGNFLLSCTLIIPGLKAWGGGIKSISKRQAERVLKLGVERREKVFVMRLSLAAKRMWCEEIV